MFIYFNYSSDSNIYKLKKCNFFHFCCFTEFKPADKSIRKSNIFKPADKSIRKSNI